MNYEDQVMLLKVKVESKNIADITRSQIHSLDGGLNPPECLW